MKQLPTALQSTINYAALGYNVNLLERLNGICKPLLENFGITHFWYSQIFNDGTYLDVTTDIEWKRHFHLYDLVNTPNRIVDAINSTPQGQTVVSLWPPQVYHQDPLLSAQLNFNICHGLNIFERKKDFVENFAFATSIKNENMINFYINHLDVLKDFIFYFKQKSPDIVSPSYKDKPFLAQGKLFIPSNQSIDYEKLKVFLQETKLNKYPIKGKNGIVYLSSREVDCITLLSRGLQPKEIARSLSLSPQKVGFYIRSSQKKTGYLTTRELMNVFLDTAIKWG